MQQAKNYSSHQLQRALAFEQQSRLPQAQRLCQAFLQKHPSDIRARCLQAKLYYRLKDYEQAERFAKKLVHDEPKMLEALRLCSAVLLDSGKLEQALEYAKKLVEMDKTNGRVYIFVAHILGCLGRTDEALEYLDKAGDAHTNSEFFITKINILHDKSEYAKVVKLCEDYLEIYGKEQQVLEFLAIALHRVGRNAEAYSACESALEIASEHKRLRLEWLLRTLVPIVYEDEQELELYKDRYIQGVLALSQYQNFAQELEADTHIFVRRPWGNFYYAYQGTNVKEAQEIRSKTIRSYLEVSSPELLELDISAYPSTREKIRIGYVSGHLHAHTVGTFFLGNYFTHDRSKFELYIYYIGNKKDNLLTDYSEHADKFICMRPVDPLGIAKEIRQDKLDVLIYPDVGMESVTSLLCVMRLAPLQCVQYGHPITTGSHAIDYYLSGIMVEPYNAHEHYTETLVKFPNIALNYQYSHISEVESDRQKFGLSEDDFIFVSPQSLFKYMPTYDWMYPAIVAGTAAKNSIYIQSSRRIDSEIHSSYEEGF